MDTTQHATTPQLVLRASGSELEDDFEEFPIQAEQSNSSGAAMGAPDSVWDNNWDNYSASGRDFDEQLRAELARHGHTATSSEPK